MTLLRSTARPGYRVYSEQEFFATRECSGEAEPDFLANGATEPRWRGRLAAFAALTAALVAVVGAAAIARTGAGGDRRSGSVRIAFGRKIARMGGPPVGGSSRRRGELPRTPAAMRPLAKRHVVLAVARAREAASVFRPPRSHSLGGVTAASAVRSATAVSVTTGTEGDASEPDAAAVPTGATTTGTTSAPTASTAAAAPMGGARPEFGFER